MNQAESHNTLLTNIHSKSLSQLNNLENKNNKLYKIKYAKKKMKWKVTFSILFFLKITKEIIYVIMIINTVFK